MKAETGVSERLTLGNSSVYDPWALLFWRLGCIVCFLLTFRVGWVLVQEATEKKVLYISTRYQVGISSFFLLSILSLFFLLSSYWHSKRQILRLFQRLEQGLTLIRKFSLIFLLGFNLILAFALTQFSGSVLQPYWARLAAFLFITTCSVPFVQTAFKVQHPGFAFIISFLISGISLQMILFLTNVSTYPFTLEWSEASRYYYASLFFGERIYGVKTAWTVLHPSRYLLQAIPFLLPDSPLWLHRLWQVGLWIGISGLTAFAFLWRFGRELPSWLWRIGLGWLFLYLLLGPVYYHLQLAILPLLLWFRPNAQTTAAKSLSILVLILSSLWAGLSRLNWYPVPALTAGLLYLLETPYRDNFWRYFRWPLIWTIGGVGLALVAHSGYIQLSGNPPNWFGTSLTSQLLWYRLFPNATFPMGILLASWVVIFPMCLLIHRCFIEYRSLINFWRWLGLLGILIGLYLGGLIVSVKIGGGSNLHNLDAFWVCFVLVFVALMTQNLTADRPSRIAQHPMLEIFFEKRRLRIALLSTLIVPVLFLLSSLEPFIRPDWPATEKALRRLQGVVKEVPVDQEVLFISERQLLTFGYLQGVRLVPEYERVFLMEMAMANNQAYLQQFYRDLRNHRFALIINEPLYLTTKGKPLPFGEENDAWVERVSKPLLCYYKPFQQARMLLMGVEIQILEPRPNPAEECSSD